MVPKSDDRILTNAGLQIPQCRQSSGFASIINHQSLHLTIIFIFASSEHPQQGSDRSWLYTNVFHTRHMTLGISTVLACTLQP